MTKSNVNREFADPALAALGTSVSSDVKPSWASKEEGFQITDEIRRVLREHACLVVEVDSLRDDDDLFRLGMTSHASVSVMLALEDAFAVEFPEQMLRRGTFESLGSIRQAISELLAAPSGD